MCTNNTSGPPKIPASSNDLGAVDDSPFGDAIHTNTGARVGLARSDGNTRNWHLQEPEVGLVDWSFD